MNSQNKYHILVVDDDANHLKTLKAIITSWGYDTTTAEDGSVSVKYVKERPYDLILMDVRMAHMSGIEALKEIKAYNPSIPILIMTAYSSVDTAVEALKAGAYDYLTKPLDFEVLKLTLERALEHKSLKTENRDLKDKLSANYKLNDIVGRSKAMKDLVEMLVMIAPSEATALITGESGTGKELIAKSLHHNSNRKEHPLIVVNCAALTETLLESELFGHEKGAFTGADKRREGRFMQADKGTIFLDEVGETSAAMQAKLLRVIQEKEIQTAGDPDRIERYSAYYANHFSVDPLQSNYPAINSIDECIGQRDLYEPCLDLVNEAMASQGVGQMVKQTLKTYPLGISSGVFHSLIRLGYAVEGYRFEPESTDEVARALAYYLTGYREAKTFSRQVGGAAFSEKMKSLTSSTPIQRIIQSKSSKRCEQ